MLFIQRHGNVSRVKFTRSVTQQDQLCLFNSEYNLRSPETCKLENILTSPPESLTFSTNSTYSFLNAMS